MLEPISKARFVTLMVRVGSRGSEYMIEENGYKNGYARTGYDNGYMNGY